MPWQHLKFQLEAASAPALEQWLLDAGAQSVTLLDAQDQPVFQLEPGAEPLWDQTQVCALFTMDTDLDLLMLQMQSQLPGHWLASGYWEVLADQDWKTAWMADFHPMQFGQRLWICPSWASPPHPEQVNVLLDPGLAFGTGTHPTTSLCLAWLDQASLAGKLVIDYGSGSGVLGIAAALLGAARVLAVDNDPQAVTATLTNRDHNQIHPDRLEAMLPDRLPASQADLVIANILAAPLIELAPRFAALLKPGADLVLSGLIPSQIDELLLTYWPWFELDPPKVQDNWVLLSGRRRHLA